MRRLIILVLTTLTLSTAPALRQDKSATDYFLEGVDHHVAGAYFDAIQDFDKAIALDPDNADTQRVRGVVAQRLRLSGN